MITLGYADAIGGYCLFQLPTLRYDLFASCLVLLKL
jgi:hypothetical protein